MFHVRYWGWISMEIGNENWNPKLYGAKEIYALSPPSSPLSYNSTFCFQQGESIL